MFEPPPLLNYWIVIFLMMTGFYIVIGQRNLIKSVIGLNIFQTSVFLLYITIGKVRGGTAPILQSTGQHNGHTEHTEHLSSGGHGQNHSIAAAELHGDIDPSVPPMVADQWDHGHRVEGHDLEPHVDGVTDVLYSNPLPSVLMLTAIVVGIATTALALALIVRIREQYGTIEEDEILALDRDEDIAFERAAAENAAGSNTAVVTV